MQALVREENSENILSVKFNATWATTSPRELFTESQINLTSLDRCNEKIYKNGVVVDSCKSGYPIPSLRNNEGYSTSCPCQLDFYYVGEVLSGKYKNWGIYYLVTKERSAEDSYSVYRFLKKGKNIVFLSKYSDYVAPSQMEIFNFKKYFLQDRNIIIPDLETPNTIRYSEYNFSLIKTLPNPRPELRVSMDELSSSGSKPLEIKIGDFSAFVWPLGYYPYYYILMPDGTTSRYKSQFSFFEVEDDSGVGHFSGKSVKYEYNLNMVWYSDKDNPKNCVGFEVGYDLCCAIKNGKTDYSKIYWKTPFEYYIEFNLVDLVDDFGNTKAVQHGGVDNMLWGKPVIYLYPSKTTDVFVQVKPAGGLTISDPEYGEGWRVQAKPNGEIFNYADDKNYPYLFWEGESQNYDIGNQGALVEKENVKKFLQESLEKQGLVKKEIDDFMDFWLPRMQAKDYYQIYFIPQNEIDRMAPLSIEPSPDKIIRVLMDYRGVDEPIETFPQNLIRPAREGFTVVEWGGILH